MRRYIAIILILSAPILTLRAASTPEEVAARYFEAFKNGDAEAVAACMHDEEMARLQEQLLPVIDQIDKLSPQSPDLEVAALKQLMGAKDAAAIRAESPREFFVRFMKWVILRNPELNRAMAGATLRTVGHVMDGDLAHVVCQVDLEVMGTSISQMKVMTLRPYEDQWRMKLTEEISGITKIMQRRAESWNRQ